jgi:hypothetical protein
MSSLFKVVQGQLDRDQSVVDLVSNMEALYSFVRPIQEFPEKLELLEDIIMDILRQTFECVIFLREYTGHGFCSMLCITNTIQCAELKFYAGRTWRETFADYSSRISEMSQRLTDLKSKFDTSINIQSASVCFRIVHKVDAIGLFSNFRSNY